MASSQSNEATKLLDYYLDDSVDTEYAVMLSAPWGAGKTHFIKKYLNDRSPRVAEDKGPYYLYASLFGVTAISAIKDQFFAQIHPQLTSKGFQLFGNIASGFVEKVSGAKGTPGMVKDLFVNLDGKILVIDDLERCSMKISDVMGFINTLVEHEKLKVIILANESEIPKAQREDYDRQKEKLVGKTIEVKADPAEVLDKLTSDLKPGAAKKIVSAEKAALLATFNASKKPNYRNLRAVLADFERLVGVVDKRLSDAPDALKLLLLYMIATGCEARSAELHEDMLRRLPTTAFSMGRLFSKSEKTPTEKAFEMLNNRYPEVRWTDPIVSPNHLADLFFSGKIAVDAINEELARHPDVVGHAQIPAWRLLWDCSHLNKSEYEKARTKLVAELAEAKLTHPGVILHVAGIAITLRGHGDQLIEGEGELLKYFTEYVSRLVDAGTLTPNKGVYGFDSMSAVGLGYSSYTSPEFSSIYSMVKDASAEALRRQLKVKAQSYVARLATGPDSYPSLYEYGIDDENYGGAPFLHHTNMGDLADLLIVDSRSNDQLFASLAKRYEHNLQTGQSLKDEYEWIENLKTHLLAMADADTAPFAKMLRDHVTYYFEKIGEGIGRPATAS
ncbi:P-loop NTPase fold protein [Pseudomonas fluorescens]|uniref:P-loop NTPase fold protein n=1 Tax=Pseudomonas fluorescens TaxID=294 RepID=UPI003D2032F7